MIAFMFIAGPRSGTTWAANWFTNEDSICLHDPLFSMHYSAWDDITADRGRKVGISCTGIAYVNARWLNDHPARKVILHRPSNEINESIARNGFPPSDMDWETPLRSIRGLHVPWTDLFENPQPIWSHLALAPFDKARHDQLRAINVQTHLRAVKQDPIIASRLKQELQVSRNAKLN